MTATRCPRSSAGGSRVTRALSKELAARISSELSGGVSSLAEPRNSAYSE